MDYEEVKRNASERAWRDVEAEISNLRKQIKESEGLEEHYNKIINELSKQLSDRDSLLGEIKQPLRWANDTGVVAEIIKFSINDPRWPSDSSSRSSTKGEPKA